RAACSCCLPPLDGDDGDDMPPVVGYADLWLADRDSAGIVDHQHQVVPRLGLELGEGAGVAVEDGPLGAVVAVHQKGGSSEKAELCWGAGCVAHGSAAGC